MDILNKISAKHFIVLIIIGGFIISKVDFVHDFIERFNLLKKFSNINPTPSTNLVAEKGQMNEIDSRPIEHSDGDNDQFCNLKKDRLGDFEKQKICTVLKKPVSSDILHPINCVPYNFSKNYNNNVLYSINPRYTKNKLKHEKKVNKKVVTSNQTPLKTNFDRDIDYYKITKRIDTIQNIKPKLKMNTHKVLNRYKIQKNLRLFTRQNNDKSGIVTNWNIPVLPPNFFPKEVVIAINNTENSYRGDKINIEAATVYMFKYKKTPSEIEETDGKFTVKSINEGNRIIYTLFSDNNNWYLEECNKHIVVIKVYFTFQFYNDNGSLQDCFIESNLSKLMY